MSKTYTKQTQLMIIRCYVLDGLERVKQVFGCSKSTVQRVIKRNPDYYNSLLQHWNTPEFKLLSKGETERFLSYLPSNPFTVIEKFRADAKNSSNAASKKNRLFDYLTKNCMLWCGALTEEGYGRFRVGNIKYQAHIVSYHLFGRTIPRRGSTLSYNGGQVLLHSCDVRRCCNPFHLTAGSQKENMLDMQVKGRSKNFGRDSIQEKASEFGSLWNLLNG